MKKRYLNIDQFLFDINTTSEDTIRNMLNMYFQCLSEKIGYEVKFELKYTENGYTYKLVRQRHHQMRGTWVIDQDCALITGLTLEDFRVSPLDPTHEPVAWSVPWYDGNYIPEEEIERVYKHFIVSDQTDIPTKVRIYATDDYASVTVEYDTNNSNDSENEKK